MFVYRRKYKEIMNIENGFKISLETSGGFEKMILFYNGRNISSKWAHDSEKQAQQAFNKILELTSAVQID